MISSDMALTECRIACCPAARASQTTAGLPAESISDVDGLFGAFGRCGCDDVVRVMRRHCIATQLIEEREQFGGFLLQQDQGTFVGLLHVASVEDAPQRSSGTEANGVPAHLALRSAGLVDATRRACVSGGFELPLRFGVHGFQRHHAGDAGGGHGAAVIGKRGRQDAACQVAGACGTNQGDMPVGNPAATGAIALSGATGQSIAT